MSICLFAGMMLNGQALKVDANGNVGINTGTPSSLFTVNAVFAGFNEIGAEFKNASAFNGFAVATNAVAGGNANFGFLVNGAAKGNIGYDGGRGFFGLLNQEYTGNDFQFRLVNDGSFAFHDPNAGPASVFTIAKTGDIGSNGGITIGGAAIKPGGGTWSAPSDKRLKNNVNDFKDGLAEIMQIRPVTFHYNGKAGLKNMTREHVGIIAQDVQKVAPYMVENFTHEEVQYVVDEGNKGATPDAIRYKKAGTIKEEYLSVDPNAFTYMLINAVQEQQDIIQNQNDRISKLEELVESIALSKDVLNSSETTLVMVDKAELRQNTPNPFNGSTSIEYVIPTEATSAQMKIYSQRGQLLRTVDIQHIGQGSLEVNADNLPSGTYSYHLIIDGKQVSANKMVLQN